MRDNSGEYNFLCIRHAHSVCNDLGIIQGQGVDGGLSDKGRKDLENAASTGLLRGHGIQTIISSDLRRAFETASYIAERNGQKIETDPLLREIDSGVLTGKQKDIARVTHAKELAIWSKYGDLDGINGAETGKEVQSRAIAFLAKIKETLPPGTYGIVSHAAFLRSMVNTAQQSPREKLIEHRHLTPIFIENALASLDFTRIGTTFTSKVYKVQSHEQAYVVKRIDDAQKESMEVENDLLRHLNRNSTRSAYHVITDYKHDGRDYTLAVGDYEDGETLTKVKSPSDFEDVCILMRDISTSLDGYSDSRITRLDERIPSIQSGMTDNDKAERNFLNSEKLRRFFDRAARFTIVDHDCHFGNFIRPYGGGIKKIDISPVIAPSMFQPASLFLSAFMLDDPENIRKIDGMRMYWPDSITESEDMIVGMKLRTCMGISYFNRLHRSSVNEESLAIVSRYKNCFSLLSSL